MLLFKQQRRRQRKKMEARIIRIIALLAILSMVIVVYLNIDTVVEKQNESATERKLKVDNCDKLRKCMDCMACIGSGNIRQKKKTRLIRCTQCCCLINCVYGVACCCLVDSVFSLTLASTTPVWVRTGEACIPCLACECGQCIGDEAYCNGNCKCCCGENLHRYQQCCGAVINDDLMEGCGYYPEAEMAMQP